MNTGECSTELLIQGLQDLSETFAEVQSQWSRAVGDEIEEFLEVLAHLLLGQIIYFLREAPGLSPDTRGLVEVVDQKRRPNFPKEVVTRLETWLAEHTERPYPTTEEKLGLSEQLGLSVKQINDWFINARRRRLHK